MTLVMDVVCVAALLMSAILAERRINWNYRIPGHIGRIGVVALFVGCVDKILAIIGGQAATGSLTILAVGLAATLWSTRKPYAPD